VCSSSNATVDQSSATAFSGLLVVVVLVLDVLLCYVPLLFLILDLQYVLPQDGKQEPTASEQQQVQK
jgi:hypothetical protein